MTGLRFALRRRYARRVPAIELLERDAALTQLAAMLEAATAGEGGLVLVSGEAGIGKTALLRHFARQQRASVRVLWGACDALFTPRPLGPTLHGHTEFRPSSMWPIMS